MATYTVKVVVEELDEAVSTIPEEVSSMSLVTFGTLQDALETADEVLRMVQDRAE